MICPLLTSVQHKSQVADSLLDAGINDVSIHLGSDNPKQFMELVQPTNGANFSDMCCFVTTCVEAGKVYHAGNVSSNLVLTCDATSYF